MKHILVTLLLFFSSSVFAQTDYLSGEWHMRDFPSAPQLVFQRASSSVSVRVVTKNGGRVFSGELCGTAVGTKLFSVEATSEVPWVIAYRSKVCVILHSELTFAGHFVSQSQVEIDDGLLEGVMKCGGISKEFTMHLNGMWVK